MFEFNIYPVSSSIIISWGDTWEWDLILTKLMAEIRTKQQQCGNKQTNQRKLRESFVLQVRTESTRNMCKNWKVENVDSKSNTEHMVPGFKFL